MDLSSESVGKMGTWCARKLAKKNRGSQSTGRQKGIVASALQKYMCRRNRSYLHPRYQEVMSSLGQRKAKK